MQKLAQYWARKEPIPWTKVTCMPALFPAAPTPEAPGGAAEGSRPSGPLRARLPDEWGSSCHR